jgi:hypothetical protein
VSIAGSPSTAQLWTGRHLNNMQYHGLILPLTCLDPSTLSRPISVPSVSCRVKSQYQQRSLPPRLSSSVGGIRTHTRLQRPTLKLLARCCWRLLSWCKGDGFLRWPLSLRVQQGHARVPGSPRMAVQIAHLTLTLTADFPKRSKRASTGAVRDACLVLVQSGLSSPSLQARLTSATGWRGGLSRSCSLTSFPPPRTRRLVRVNMRAPSGRSRRRSAPSPCRRKQDRHHQTHYVLHLSLDVCVV